MQKGVSRTEESDAWRVVLFACAIRRVFRCSHLTANLELLTRSQVTLANVQHLCVLLQGTYDLLLLWCKYAQMYIMERE